MASYNVNYNDKRFTQVTSEKNTALKESDKTYDSIINNSDKYYQQQIDAANQWGETQKQLQQEQTDFAIEKIEQQKDQAHKDYLKEQTGAYVDWQKQSNDYGSNAEKMASSGLAHTGYSESSQVSMYNTYQNRVASARESYTRAVLNYDNAIKDAQLQNSSALAEIAYNTLQKSLELSLQGFQYKNQLVLEKANKKAEIEDRYYTRYQNVLSQINTENSMAEQIRQYNESLALQREQFEWQKKNSNVSSSGGSSSKKSSSSKGTAKNTKGTTKTTTTNTKKQTSFSSYEEAAAYMRKTGAATGDGGLMTKSEWARRKSSGSKSAEASYSSYSEYLNNFVAWRTANPMK